MSTEPDSPPVVSMEELRSDEPVKASPKSLMDSLTQPVEPARTGASGKSSDDYGPTSTHASEAPQKAAKAARVGVLGWLAARENRKAAEARANQVKTVRTETVTESRVTGNQSLSKSDTKGSSNRQDANKSSRDTKRADTGSVRDHRNADDKSTKGNDTKRADTRADQSKSDRKKSDSSADKSSTDRKDTRGHDTKNQSSTGRTRPESDKRKATLADLRQSDSIRPVSPPRVPTQSSREAGYRDGQRVAKGAGHVQAYGDGTRDGWQAGRKDTEAQRRELNRRRDEPKKETENVTTPTDTATKPVVVTGIDKDGVTLGDGARPSMTRGEVRSLKSFTDRLAEAENFLVRKADVARQIAAAAAQLHHEAVQMQESVRSVKGGEKLAGALGRLVESSQGRVSAAEEVHTKALQAAEKAKTLRTNTDTRYAPIYQAVVDSDETLPAELAFYRDGGITRG